MTCAYKLLLVYILCLIIISCSHETIFICDYPYINSKYYIPDIVNEKNIIRDSLMISQIANVIGDSNLNHYGNWFTYYELPIPHQDSYKLIFRTDDNSESEYMIQTDDNGKITNCKLVAKSYGDGAEFETIYSLYNNKRLKQYSLYGRYHFTNDSTDVIDTSIPPIVDTVVKLIHF